MRIRVLAGAWLTSVVISSCFQFNSVNSDKLTRELQLPRRRRGGHPPPNRPLRRGGAPPTPPGVPGVEVRPVGRLK